MLELECVCSRSGFAQAYIHKSMRSNLSSMGLLAEIVLSE